MNTPLLTNLFLNIKDTIYYFRVQDFFHGQQTLDKVTMQMNELLTVQHAEKMSDVIQPITQALQNIFHTQQNNDTVLLADLLEIQLLPLFDTLLQESILSAKEGNTHNYLEENLKYLNNSELVNQIREHAISSQYSIEQTNLGLYTVKYSGEKTLYYHSNVNPKEDGKLFASYYGKNDVLSYTVFGFGMGYHVEALLNHDRRYTVEVIETNLDILKSAFSYCDLVPILSNKRFQLRYCTLDSIQNLLAPDSTLLLHYPSYQALKGGPVKEALNNYFISLSTMYGQGNLLLWNFYDNMQWKDSCVDELCSDFKGKDIIYVGGGPSLEYCMEELYTKSLSSNHIIMCASTVYRHLIEHHIIPDYVIMIDPQEHMIRHIKDIPETKTKMLYLCTAASNAVQEFKGKRYIIFQKDYPDANKYATSRNYTLFETGGSVSTLAIDLAIRFGCRQLITLGLDLGYTENKTHSFENSATLDKQSLLYVKSVTGATIPTTRVLNSYRHWIQNRIRDSRDISFVNLSCGAVIEGMENRVSW